MNTTEAAMNRWNGILQNFGIDRAYLSDKHGPCPICGGKDRFRFDDKGGRGTWFCNSCGAGNGFDLAMRITGLEFKEVAREIDKFVGMIPECESKRPRNDPSILLKRISQNLERPTKHDPVGKYLERRGVEIPEFGVFYSPCLAYFEEGKFSSNHPAMVCQFRNPGKKLVNYHVTYLTESGEKAKVGTVRKFMPPLEPMAGGAIMCAKPGETLGVAEGLETALSAGLQHQIPVWACGDAGLLEKWQPPEFVKEVIIYGDNDANFAGHAAAYKLAHRLAVKGLCVAVSIPPAIGTDWNDYQQVRAKA